MNVISDLRNENHISLIFFNLEGNVFGNVLHV